MITNRRRNQNYNESLKPTIIKTRRKTCEWRIQPGRNGSTRAELNHHRKTCEKRSHKSPWNGGVGGGGGGGLETNMESQEANTSDTINRKLEESQLEYQIRTTGV